MRTARAAFSCARLLHLGLLYVPELAAAIVTAIVFGAVFSTRLIHYYALTGMAILAVSDSSWTMSRSQITRGRRCRVIGVAFSVAGVSPVR